MKRSAAIVFFFSLACVFFMPLYAEIPDGRQALKEIDVVMDDNYPPYTFRDSTGQLRGILVDEWRLWQEKTGIRVKLKGMDWDKAQTAVKEGRAQVIDTLFFSEERAGSFDFSVPYHEIGVSVFFNRDISGITGIDTLQGFTIGVKSGDACIGMLKKQGITPLDEYPNYESIVRAASEKKVKVFCIDNPPALYFLYRMNLEGDFRHTAPLYTGRFHRAVQRGRRDILAAVEKGFAAISPGEYEAIEKKWLGYAIAELPYIRYASYALALLFFLGLTALLWNHLLRRQVARKTAQIEAMLKDLQESGEKLRTLSDNIAGGLVYRLEEDEEGRERRFSYISAGVRQLHEVDISESLNDPMTLYGQVLDEDRPLLAAREEAAKNSMSALSAEVRIRVPSGGIKWVTINSTPRRLSGGSLVWDGIEVDITDRKRAEEALVESYSILKSVLESPRTW
jgi:ABC-type amino acid transport substrate-binding protein